MPRYRLDERVTVVAVTEEEDEYGTVTEVQTDGRTLYADVSVQSGNEAIRQGQTEETARATVRLRYHEADQAGVTSGALLRYRGDLLRIHSRREIGSREYMELTCTRSRI
jgi:SPP1 family predicted phage head-tail adaptor